MSIRKYMTFSDILDVVKKIIIDWRLIVAFVVVFTYLNFVFYVSKYKKKEGFKPKLVIRRKAAPEATPAGGETAQSSESSSEDLSEDDVLV